MGMTQAVMTVMKWLAVTQNTYCLNGFAKNKADLKCPLVWLVFWAGSLEQSLT